MQTRTAEQLSAPFLSLPGLATVQLTQVISFAFWTTWFMLLAS